MNSTRETTTLKTPTGREIIFNDYVIGIEKMTLQQTFMSKTDDAAQFKAAQDLAFKTVVVAVDGHKDGEVIDGKQFSILDAIYNMRLADYSFIVKTVNKITADDKFEEKKTN